MRFRVRFKVGVRVEIQVLQQSQGAKNCMFTMVLMKIDGQLRLSLV